MTLSKPQFLRSLAIAFFVASTFFGVSRAATPINGAGSTFIEPIATKWFYEFHNKNKNTQINYQGIGSGAGIRQLMAGTVDFAASDDPMKAEEEATLKTPVLHVPVILGAVVVSYNLPLEKPLKLTGETVAQIFMGEIKAWNDERISKLNPGVKLPEMAITPAYRSDGSGTTAVFTDYLAKIYPAFKEKIGQGKTVSWSTGMGGKGNNGVAGLVTQMPGAVGYVELTYAVSNKMKYAEIKNSAGAFVTATTVSVTAAASKATPALIKNHFKLSITNSEVTNAYPISSFSWLVLPTKWTADKGQNMKPFLEWVLNDEAQKMAEQLNYAALPKELTRALLIEVGKIDFGTKDAALTR